MGLKILGTMILQGLLKAFTGVASTPVTIGSLWNWGEGSYGELGDNTIVKKSSPVQTVAFGTNWKSVACGITLTSAIKTDGTLWNWGYHGGYALGDQSGVASRSSPVQTVAYGNNWKQVSSGKIHTAAVTNGDI